ncbi:hypothetical protein NDN01_12510 [Sphingomonas sp. QA11]|uniref:hypothetical protein n=1 Tax=Sphingomonas sp. QA11 TaxID=2950605 RepID=UPI002349B0A0|nr:hypothetical protein [Sphingomonas sp. QA11]WCM29646.1 hypothetical protein NDN01_12510 [Sphingomonas sp. QA11]
MADSQLSLEQIREYWANLAQSFENSMPGYICLSAKAVSVPRGYEVMSDKSLATARSAYAKNLEPSETPVLLHEYISWLGLGSIKQGYLITDRAIYSLYEGVTRKYEFHKISDITISDMILYINGTKFAFVGSSSGVAIVKDFLSRLAGLNSKNVQTFAMDQRASEHCDIAGIRAEIGPDEPIQSILRRRDDVLEDGHKVRHYECILIMRDTLISTKKFTGILAQGSSFKVLPKSNFTKIRIISRYEHPHIHSHTPHAVSHMIKDASTGNILTAAASVAADINQHYNPPAGKLVFDVYAETPRALDEGAGYAERHRVFYGIDPSREEYIIDFLNSLGLPVEKSGKSPY